MTEPEKKKEHYDLIKKHNCSELKAGFFIKVESIDKAIGIKT